MRVDTVSAVAVAESNNNNATKLAQSPLTTPTITRNAMNISPPAPDHSPPVLPAPPSTSNVEDAKMPATLPPRASMALDPGPSTRPIHVTEASSVPPTPITPIYKPESPVHPPPPDGSAPLQPPWPVPAPPKVLSHDATVEVSEEDKQHEVEKKRAVWEERTRLLADAVLSRQRRQDLEAEVQRAEGIVNSAFFTSLPVAERTRLEQQLDDMKDDVKIETAKYEEVMEKLRISDPWPVAPVPDPNEDLEEQAREDHKEIVRYIDELNTTVKAMQRELGSITTLKPPPTLPIEPEEDGEDGMDVDRPAAADAGPSKPASSRKRRRTTDDVDGETELPTREDLDKLLDRLVRLESATATLQNDLTEHDRDMQDELQVALEARLDDLHARLAKEREEREAPQKEAEQAWNSRIEAASQDTELMGEQVGELAEEMSSMLIKVSDLEAVLAEKMKERQESYNRVLQVEQRLLDFSNARQANTSAIQTLEAALKAYTSRPPSPPATPKFHPSILESLEERLVESLRESMMPLMGEVRKDVEMIVQEKNSQLYKTTWEGLKFTLDVLAKISSKLDQGKEVTDSSTGSTAGVPPHVGAQQ
ncbi:unnamed protein product [Cyclocybe aegerita]|uniref:Uncharacterized protein n=1 Tax=Cyclocybe aegerita TaxID=1973307 RepID=A0A8S0W572_CYCAE|nr:unnamed protein product [Cyclocybe aegerita]